MPEVFQSGFAIAPTGHMKSVTGSAAIAARFSSVLHLEALTQIRGVEILSPELVLEILGRDQGFALAELREARRALAGEVSPAPEALLDIADQLGQRYLLLTWVDERANYGLEDMPLDFSEGTFANDTGRAEFRRLEGDLHGVVLDLQGAEILWKGRAGYQSEKDFGVAKQKLRDMEDELRNRAAYDLIVLLVSSG